MTKKELCILIVSWNRPEFLKQTIESILQNVARASTDLFVVDNGSDSETRALIRNCPALTGYLLLNSNLGINGAIERWIPPSLEQIYEVVLISDADMLYRTPLNLAVEMLRSEEDIGAVSYQHSPEHAWHEKRTIENIEYLLKDSERGCSLFLRSKTLESLRPLPKNNLKDFDWWVCRDAPRSLQQQEKSIAVLAGGAMHLGWRAGDSTWQDEEIAEYHELKQRTTST